MTIFWLAKQNTMVVMGKFINNFFKDQKWVFLLEKCQTVIFAVIKKIGIKDLLEKVENVVSNKHIIGVYSKVVINCLGLLKE